MKARPGWPRLWLLLTGNYRDILTKFKLKFFGDATVQTPATSAPANKPGAVALAKQLLPLVLVQSAVWAFFAWCLG